MQIEYVGKLLGSCACIRPTEDGAAVSTHCLYPSNQAVTVFVSGGPTGMRVHDGGGAIDTLATHGVELEDPKHFLLRFCRRHGLKVDRGKIYTPTLPPEGLCAGIVMVANASADAARWGVDHMKPAVRSRDLRKELHELLALTFSEERVKSDGRLTGKSNRQYHFDHVVAIDRDSRLVVDAVLRDASSINSRAIAHMDLGQTEDPNLIQRIVYDDEEEWDTADLNLLQMAATLVPYSGFAQALSRLQKVH